MPESSAYLTREERIKLKKTAQAYGLKGYSPETEIQIVISPEAGVCEHADQEKTSGLSRRKKVRKN